MSIILGLLKSDTRWPDLVGVTCRPWPGPGQHRSLPGDLAHLDDFIATRDVAFGLWFVGTAQTNPVFRADLDQVLGDVSYSLDALLGD